MATDGARPLDTKYQATAAALVFKQASLIKASRHVVGKVTSVEAELSAIATGIELACQEQCRNIVVFTDSMVQAMKSIDLSAYSRQQDSLCVCRAM